MGYSQPRKLNVVTITFLLLFAAAGYWMWLFFPVYWDAWTVDHQLREGASALYNLNRVAEPARSIEMRKVLRKVKADSQRLAGITDPDFEVTLDQDGDNISMTAQYTVVVKHPVGNWKTTIHLNRVEKANVKKVQWD